MAFPVSTWPCGCDEWCVYSDSPEKVAVDWTIGSFLSECQGERKKLRSYDFGFAGATWDLFTSFDGKEDHSLFGINVKPLRFSDIILDCDCRIDFDDTSNEEIKTIDCKFKCENADSHWLAENFLSNSEFDKFLKEGEAIHCTITVTKSSIKEACPRAGVAQSSGSSTVAAHTETQLLPGYSMAFPDSTWPCGCDLWSVRSSSLEKVTVFWHIGSFLRECQEERKGLKSYDFGFAGATWNLFTSFHGENVHSLFGINVKPHQFSEAVFDCDCEIKFYDYESDKIKTIGCRFKCGSSNSYNAVQNFLSNSELEKILQECRIVCTITVKKWSIKEACTPAEITHSSSSGAVVAHALTQMLPNVSESEEEVVKKTSGKTPKGKQNQGVKRVHIQIPDESTPKKTPKRGILVSKKQATPEGDEELPVARFESKVCKDLKNLLLSGEDCDVTLQVQDQQFKAHRTVLTARSSVFASMFRHDTKEKATGVVNVEDCEPSSFPVLLEFMYCGSTEKLSVDNMFSLYVSSDKYDLQDLEMKCLQFIKSNLSVDTFCKTLHLSLQHSEKDLSKFATEFFIRNYQQITITPEWITFLSENPIQGNELFIKATKYISLNPS